MRGDQGRNRDVIGVALVRSHSRYTTRVKMGIGRFENPSVESHVIDTREGEMDTRSRSKESIEFRIVDTSAVS